MNIFGAFMKFKKLIYCFVVLVSQPGFGIDKKCAKEGETAGGSTLAALQCCPGLIATNSWTYEHVKEGCNIPPPPGSGGSCAKCGDGKCDTKNFESKCDCPKDCK